MTQETIAISKGAIAGTREGNTPLRVRAMAKQPSFNAPLSVLTLPKHLGPQGSSPGSRKTATLGLCHLHHPTHLLAAPLVGFPTHTEGLRIHPFSLLHPTPPSPALLAGCVSSGQLLSSSGLPPSYVWQVGWTHHALPCPRIQKTSDWRCKHFLSYA